MSEVRDMNMTMQKFNNSIKRHTGSLKQNGLLTSTVYEYISTCTSIVVKEFVVPVHWSAAKAAEVAAACERMSQKLKSMVKVGPSQLILDDDTLLKLQMREAIFDDVTRLRFHGMNIRLKEKMGGQLNKLEDDGVLLRTGYALTDEYGIVTQDFLAPVRWDATKAAEVASACEAMLLILQSLESKEEFKRLSQTFFKDGTHLRHLRQAVINDGARLRQHHTSLAQIARSAEMPVKELRNSHSHLSQIEGQLRMELNEASREKEHLRAENVQLKCDLAKFKDRCERLKTENIRLREEKDDLVGRLVPPAISDTNQISISSQSGYVCGNGRRADDSISEIGSWVSVASQGSNMDQSSVFSVCASEGHCFMADDVFKATCGSFAVGRTLHAGSEILAADGETPIKVVGEPQLHKTSRLVEICADGATLTVTRDHRIPMLDRFDSQQRDAKAVELLPGNFVFVHGQPVELTSVEEFVPEQEVDVLKITFAPDCPVGVFAEPATIASRGSKRKPLRRSVKKHERHATQDAATIEQEE